MVNCFGFDVEKPIKFLPEDVASMFRLEAKWLYRDLTENLLKVVLRPAYQERYNGHMIRVVESQNPQWYREIYHSTPNFKRQRTLRSLERIAQAEDLPYIDRRGAVSPYGSYDTRFREVIKSRVTEGYEDVQGRWIPGDKFILGYFEVNIGNSFKES